MKNDLNYDYLYAGMMGAGSVATASVSLFNILTAVNAKAISLEAFLRANTSGSTDKAYQTAIETIERLGSDNFHTGMVTAAIAGFMGAAALYFSITQDKIKK